MAVFTGPMTFDALVAAVVAEMQTRDPTLTDLSEGSTLDGLSGLVAMAAEETIRLILQRAAGLFIETAAGDDLDTIVYDRTGLVRNAASSAVGEVTVTRTTAVGDVVIAAGAVFRAVDDDGYLDFEADDEVTMLAADDEAVVAVTAITTGRRYNVQADEVVYTSLSGCTCTNGEAMAGGAEEETDTAFRGRARRFYPTARRGTVAALEEGALEVDGVVAVTVDESHIDPEDGGYVGVYIADAEGTGNAVLAAAVESELENWRAAGIQLHVVAAERQELTVALSVTVPPNTNTVDLECVLRAAVEAYQDGLKPGASHYSSALATALHAADRTRVKGVQQTTPSAFETAPNAAYKSIRIPDGSLTFAFVVES